jgi:hypothetical protein
VVFKRRNKRSVFAWARQLVYPTGGFARAARYMLHRMRRLPDEPHRIARGVFAGTFVNFPPIFGIQFLSAGLLAWAMRGNILAALLCTFLSNPITTPIIAVTSLELGHWMLGIQAPLDIRTIFNAFADADENPQLPGSDWDLNFSGQDGTTKVSISIYNESLERLEKMIELGFREGTKMQLKNLEELLKTLSVANK